MVAAAVAAGCRSAGAPMPLEQLNAQQAKGHAVFQTRCAQCHYDRVDEPRNGPSLLGVFKKQSLHSGLAATDERVTATVMRGHGMMPAMGDQVDEQDMADLLAYLHTL
jgi:mono/diheme cytochrome c family protein